MADDPPVAAGGVSSAPRRGGHGHSGGWRGRGGKAHGGSGGAGGKPLAAAPATAASARPPRPPAPTHFLSVRCVDPHLWRAVTAVQDRIQADCDGLSKCRIAPTDLHATMGLGALPTPAHVAVATFLIQCAGELALSHLWRALAAHGDIRVGPADARMGSFDPPTGGDGVSAAGEASTSTSTMAEAAPFPHPTHRLHLHGLGRFKRDVAFARPGLPHNRVAADEAAASIPASTAGSSIASSRLDADADAPMSCIAAGSCAPAAARVADPIDAAADSPDAHAAADATYAGVVASAALLQRLLEVAGLSAQAPYDKQQHAGLEAAAGSAAATLAEPSLHAAGSAVTDALLQWYSSVDASRTGAAVTAVATAAALLTTDSMIASTATVVDPPAVAPSSSSSSAAPASSASSQPQGARKSDNHAVALHAAAAALPPPPPALAAKARALAEAVASEWAVHYHASAVATAASQLERMRRQRERALRTASSGSTDTATSGGDLHHASVLPVAVWHATVAGVAGALDSAGAGGALPPSGSAVAAGTPGVTDVAAAASSSASVVSTGKHRASAPPWAQAGVATSSSGAAPVAAAGSAAVGTAVAMAGSEHPWYCGFAKDYQVSGSDGVGRSMARIVAPLPSLHLVRAQPSTIPCSHT